MNRREFLKSTAVAAAFPLAILPESEKRLEWGPKTLAGPKQTSLKWLLPPHLFLMYVKPHPSWSNENYKLMRPLCIVDVCYKREDFFGKEAPTIIIEFSEGYRYQFIECSFTEGMVYNGRRYFEPGEEYISACDDPNMSLDQMSAEMCISDEVAFAFFKARGLKGAEFYEEMERHMFGDLGVRFTISERTRQAFINMGPEEWQK